jgi:hypothetical protein
VPQGVADPSGSSSLYVDPQGPFFVYFSAYFFIPYFIRPVDLYHPPPALGFEGL